MLLFGRLSNHVGRRPVAMAALLVSRAGCLVLAGGHGLPPPVLARVLQGLGCGLASSGRGAYVFDSAPERPAWLAAAITGGAPMVGIPIGALAMSSRAKASDRPARGDGAASNGSIRHPRLAACTRALGVHRIESRGRSCSGRCIDRSDQDSACYDNRAGARRTALHNLPCLLLRSSASGACGWAACAAA